MGKTTEELVLQVSATQELLERQLKEAGRHVDTFEQAAEARIDQLEKKFSGMKLTGAIDAVKDADREFKAAFGNIQKLAGDVAGSMGKAGAVDLGPLIAQGKARVTALQNEAEAIRVVSAAMNASVAGRASLNVEEQASLAAARAAVVASQQKTGAAEQEVLRLQQLQAAIGGTNTAQRTSVVVTGQQKAGLQQIAYNINDVAVSFSTLGFKASSFFMIFAQQGSQFVQAVSLMQKESKGFIGFLGGPWGAVVMGAVTIIGLLVSKHMEAADAEKEHGKAADLLQQAVERLNSASSANNHETRLGIIADIDAAKAKRELARDTLAAAEAKLKELQAKNKSTEAAMNDPDADVATKAGLAVSGVSQGQIDSQLAEIKRLRTEVLHPASAAVVSGYGKLAQREVAAKADPRTAIQQRYADTVDVAQRSFEKTGNLKGYNAALLSAATLRDTSLEGLKPDKTKGAAATAARRAEAVRQRELSEDISFTDQERQLRKKLLDATAKTTTSELARDDILRQDINAEADATRKKIDLRQQKNQLSGAEADQLRALNENVRAQQLLNVDIERRSQTLRQQANADQHGLDAQISLLRIQGDLADTAKERKRIALEILKHEQELARRALQLVIDDPKSGEADVSQAQADRRALDQRQGAETQAVERQYESPGQSYMRGLVRSTDQINEAVEGIKVDALDNLNDGIVDAIMGVSSLGDMFSNVAKQIIADLIRIAVQKTIVNALGNVLGLGGIGGSSGSAGAGFSAPSLSALPDIWSIKPSGARAAGGPVWPGGAFLVGEHGPELFSPPSHGNIIANDNLRQPRISARDVASRPQVTIVKMVVEANDYFDARVDQRAVGVAAPMATQGAMAGANVAETRMNRRARNQIPG